MTHYSRQIASALRVLAARGGIVTYTPCGIRPVANNPLQPWKVGVAGVPDPNAALASVQVSMVFLDAKARGSSTQGMAAEFVYHTTIVGGNKMGLLAGGAGVTPVVGDKIDRGAGYPTYSVAKFKSLDIDGSPILFTIELEL